MAQQWIVKRPQAASAAPPTPTPDVLPNAVLGTPVITTRFATDQNNQLIVNVTIPVSWPSNNAADVDRLILHLLAPDNTVDTQEGFTGGPGTGGTVAGQETPGIMIGTSTTASKIVGLESTGIVIERPWDVNRPFLNFENPGPTEPEYWRIIIVSASQNRKNKVTTSPSVRLYVTPQGADVPGVEYAPNALNFRLVNPSTGATTNLPYYDVAEGGAQKWGFSARWDNDTKDPRYPVLGGYDLAVVYPDGKIETTASKSSNDTSHDSTMWDIGAPGTFALRLLSWTSQAGNRRNSYVVSVTPEVRFLVGPQTGPTGSENAANVTGFALTNSYYGKNAQGQKTLYLPFSWVKPALDRAYVGGIIVMIRADAVHYPLTGLETGTSQICEIQQYPTTPEAVTFYFKSVSGGGDPNTYKAGYPGDSTATPAIAFTLQPPASTNPAVSAVAAGLFYAKDEFQANVYGYSGSWTNPNAALFPEFQGVRVYKADSAGTASTRKALTGIETQGRFRTDAWPVVPETGIYLWFVSVDVNGVEADFTTSPKIGPLSITAQGGTLTNAALPDIQIADFAAGLEPVSFINRDPLGLASIASSRQAKLTTTVYNQFDQRMYRWKQPLTAVDDDGQSDATGGYKVIGTVADIVAASIFSGKIQAGAIATRELSGQQILVGPPPSGAAGDQRPIMFQAQNVSRQMVGFLGTYSGWEGVYAVNLRVGPNFTTPMLEADANGLYLRGTPTRPVSFEISSSDKDAGGNYTGGDFIRMTQATFDPTYSSLAVLVSNYNGLWQNYMVSRGMVLYEGGRKYAALARNPGIGANWASGELSLYASGIEGPSAPIRVYLTATGKTDGFGNPQAWGVVRADEFRPGSFGGLTTAGLVTLTKIQVVGGIVVSVA